MTSKKPKAKVEVNFHCMNISFKEYKRLRNLERNRAKYEEEVKKNKAVQIDKYYWELFK